MNRILFDANVLFDFFIERNSLPEKLEKLFPVPIAHRPAVPTHPQQKTLIL